MSFETLVLSLLVAYSLFITVYFHWRCSQNTRTEWDTLSDLLHPKVKPAFLSMLQLELDAKSLQTPTCHAPQGS